MRIETAGIKKGIHVAAPLLGAFAGIVTTINAANAKYGGAASTFAPDRIRNTLSPILGPDLANKVTGQSSGGRPLGSFNPFGPFNNYTYTGAGLLILDYVVKHLVGSKYGYGWVGPFIKAIGGGILAGGVVGGFLDQPSEGNISSPVTSLRTLAASSSSTSVTPLPMLSRGYS